MKFSLNKRYHNALTITAIVLLILSYTSYTKNNPRLPIKNSKTMKDTLKMLVNVSGEGTPLLLVPGGLTGWKSWEPFVDIFAARQKEVIRVQLLNVQYGIEDRALPHDYSVKTESSALAATLDSLGYAQPLDIVGWSYGALTTLDYALDHPERIRSLTLIEPPAIWVLRAQGLIDSEAQRFIDFAETLHGDITEDKLATFLQEVKLLKEGQSPEELPQWEQWVQYRQSLRNSDAILAQRDVLKRLQNFEPPVLLVKGTGSAPFLHRITDVLAAHLPNAHMVEMPAGHAPHIVSRDKFLLELENFQNDVGKSKQNVMNGFSQTPKITKKITLKGSGIYYEIYGKGEPLFLWIREQQTSEEQVISILNQVPNYAITISETELKSINTATLLVTGDNDPATPLACVLKAKNNLPNAYLWVVPNTEHSAHKDENKQEFIRISKEFLSDHWKK